MSRNLDNAIYDILTLEENPRTNFAGNSLEFRGSDCVSLKSQHGRLRGISNISSDLRTCFANLLIFWNYHKFSHYLLLLERNLSENDELTIKLSQDILALTLSNQYKNHAHKRTFKFPQKPTYNELMSFLTCHTLDMISTYLKLPTNSN